MAGINKKIDWLRMGLCAVAVCTVAIIFFSFYEGRGAEIIAELASDGKSPNLLWLAERVFLAIPVLAMVVVSELFYLYKKNYVPVYTQIEKLIIFGVGAFFIYTVMLPYVKASGNDIIDPDTGEVIKSLWNRTYKWFFAQIVPLLITICYHVVRIGSEKAELSAPQTDVEDSGDEDEVEDDE